MSSTYNAITNLQEIEMDSLIVNLATIDTALIENLDCNVGTIDTLTSTTATINSASIPSLTSTTAGITTANITNNNSTNVNVSSLTASKIVLTDASKNLISSLYTDTDFARLIANNVFTGNNTFRNTTINPTYVFTTSFIRPQTVSDNLQIGDNSTSGVFTIGNTTPANDSGTIVLNRSTSLGSGKNLTLQGTGGISLSTGTIDSNGNISTSSILLSNTVRARTVGNSVNLFDNGSGQINFGNGASTAFIVFNQLLYMNGKDITIVGSTNKLTTPNITLSGTQTASKLLLTDASKNVVSSLYDETTLPVSTPTQTALNLKANIDNPTFTTKITTPVITFNGTQSVSKILLTDASKNVVSSLYTDTDFARLTANNTFTNNNTIQGALSCNDIRSIAPHTANVNLFPLSTGTINIGLSVGGGNLNLNTNTILSADKYLEITGTGYLILPTAVANTNAFIRCEKYNTWGALNPVSLFISTTGLITLGNTSGTLTIDSTTTFSNSMTMAVNRNITVSAGGKLTTPNITLSGTQTASKLLLTDASKNIVSSLYDETTLPVSTPQQTALNLKANIDNPTFTTKITTPVITFNGTQTASKILLTDSSKNVVSSLYDETTLPVSTPQQTALNLKANIANPTFTGIIIAPEIQCPLYNSTNATTLLEIGKTTTTADIYLGQAQTSGSCVIGNLVPANDLGGLTINKFTTIAKVLTLSSNFVSSNIRGATIGTSVNIYPSTTTGSIAIGEAQTSGGIQIGNTTPAFDLGTLTINKNTTLGTSKNLQLLSGTVFSDTFEPYNPANALIIGATIGGSPIFIANNQTSGGIQIGNSVPANDSGTLTINKNTSIATGKNLNIASLTASKIVLSNGSKNLISSVYTDTDFVLKSGSSISGTLNVNDIQGTTTSSAITLFTNSSVSTPTITIGNASGGNMTINPNVVIGSGKNITFSTTGKIVVDTIEAIAPSETVSLFATNTTAGIVIGGGLTTAGVQIGNTTPGTNVNSLISLYNKVRFSTATNTSWINCNTGANVFTASTLSGKFITSTTYTDAPNEQWSCWDSNAQGGGVDSSAIVQNGTTTMLIGPGDQSAFWWLDEDSFTTATNWAWVGFKFSTTGVMTASSDRRIKRDINPIPIGNDLLDRLQKIEYVNYKRKPRIDDLYYKNGKLREKYQEVHKGVIAQDIKLIFPDVVNRETADSYWNVKYPEIDIYFNMGVQELIKQNKDQQIQIDTQKIQIEAQNIIIDELKNRLERLEKLILPV